MMAASTVFMLLTLVVLSETGLAQDVYGYPVRGCPAINSLGSVGFYYIADSSNPCVVWLCFNGELVGNTPFKCPEGMGIVPDSQGTSYNRCRPLAECGGPEERSTTTTEKPTIDFSKSLADIYKVEPGYYLPQGQPQRGVRDFQTCMYSCIQTLACQAFDYDALRGICYFHSDPTVCGNLSERPFSVHVRLTSCEAEESSIAELTTMLPNYRIRGSVVQPDITGFTLCLLACVDTETCSGFEVDTRTGTCYFHDDTTICNQPQAYYYRSLYRLDKCSFNQTPDPDPATTTDEVSTPATVTEPMTLPPSTQIIRGYHQFQGHFQRDVSSVEDCVSRCLESPRCHGVDWNTQFYSCWFHNLERECKELSEAEGVTHYRLTDQCGPIRTEAPPTVPTTTATTTTTTEPTTLPPLPPPPGFVSVSPGMNAQNAIRRLIDATEQQCLDACLMTSFCLSVDHDANEKTCWMHGRASYCNELQPCENCTHFQRAPCVDGVTNDIVEVNYKFHSLGGDEICTYCPRLECIGACLNDSTCLAVDYNEQAGGSCYKHTNDTVCDPLRQKDLCTHYSKEACSLALVQLQDFQAPTGDFLNINYMGPTNLPSGWQAYPGMHVAGGDVIGDSSVAYTGDECVDLCRNNDTCSAVDFDSETGFCYSLSEDLKCNNLSSANHIYHAKKPPVCEFINRTTDPYPQSIGIAP